MACYEAHIPPLHYTICSFHALPRECSTHLAHCARPLSTHHRQAASCLPSEVCFFFTAESKLADNHQLNSSQSSISSPSAVIYSVIDAGTLAYGTIDAGARYLASSSLMRRFAPMRLLNGSVLLTAAAEIAFNSAGSTRNERIFSHFNIYR